ncbi:hypothetical protein PMZ80_005540 [Knufia obscura]|uniref:Uncharacterized protein n=2 Tax=Knufia TaxID=430999 RepID=A0AAN8E9R6_9EURO|nr:hypothetical protein PMZ80_005540 [Knufia obscura]KAK5950009.1 hypothetical protein OHC33_008970 [Knufia fluminis]
MAQSTAHIISSADGQVFTRAQVMSMMLVAEKIDTIEDTVFVACIGGTDANTFKPDMLIRTLRSTERITANEDKWMCQELQRYRYQGCGRHPVLVAEAREEFSVQRPDIQDSCHTPNDETTKPPNGRELPSKKARITPVTVRNSRYTSANTLAFFKKTAEKTAQPSHTETEAEELAITVSPMPKPYNEKDGMNQPLTRISPGPNNDVRSNDGGQEEEAGWTFVEEPMLDDGDWNIIIPSTMVEAGEARVWAMQ